MKIMIGIAVIISFFIVSWVTPWVISYMKNLGVVVKDQHKENKPLIPISGGLAVFFGILASSDTDKPCQSLSETNYRCLKVVRRKVRVSFCSRD